ncbi:MAG: O-antigen ligase family protein, partial [Candidatus Nealsonbacteria bacterium]
MFISFIKNIFQNIKQNILYSLLLTGFFLIILQILNVTPFWSDPNDWGKAIFFRIILSLMIIIFVWDTISNRINLSYLKAKIKSISILFWTLVALFLSYLLATIFSLNFHFSLWGDPNRNGGFVNFSFYIIFAILAFLIIKRKDWIKILNFSIFIGIPVSILAIFQQFGILSKFFISFSNRPISTMGNPLLLAIYLILLTFITLVLGLKTKNKYQKAFYFSSFFLFLFVNIFLTQSRGALIGLIIGFLWLIFAYPNSKFKKIKIYLGVFLIIIFCFAYFAKIYLDSHPENYQKMPL